MVIIAIRIIGGNTEFEHKGIHSDLRQKIDHGQARLLRGGGGIGEAAIPAGGLFAEGDGDERLAVGNILAIHAGKKPAASLCAQIFIHRKEHGTGVIARDHAALLCHIGIKNLIKVRILRIVIREAKIREQTNADARRGLGIVLHADLPRFGHHHADVSFQLLGGKINRRGRRNFINRKHIFSFYAKSKEITEMYSPSPQSDMGIKVRLSNLPESFRS